MIDQSPRMPTSAQTFEEQHYPIRYWSRRWGFSEKTVREWFRDEYGPGILRQKNIGRRSKRDYTTIMVSASAAARVYAKRTAKLRHSREMTILCSPKVTQHHPQKVALLPSRTGHFCPWAKAARTWHSARRRMIGFTAQVGSDADRVLYTLFAWMTERQTARLRVDDIACPSSCPAANRVLRVGHFKRAELGHFCRAPRRQGANSIH